MGYLDQLNDQQCEAVVYLDGPELVIAGAGSGKTRVLTYKIAHLINCGFEPWRILALTFTNKAANEMRERVEKIVGTGVSGKLWMGTFHSIFARILRVNADRLGYKSSYTIYDTADSKALVKMIIKDMNLDEKIYKVQTVLSTISSAKNALVSPDEYALDREIQEYDRQSRHPLMYEIYRAYNERCFIAGAMDFDDLLFNTYRLFRDNPDILRHYREYFRYVLVDEYQDTNYAQHAIIRQLTSGQGNLCVVGDDAQSIYSFRGASIGNILNLSKQYPDLKTCKLEQNYRSSQTIINAANSLISKNEQQIPKNVFSRNEIGCPIEVVKTYSDMEEASLVASRISRLKMSSEDSYEEYAVLYRTNAQSRQLEEALRKRNIPYRIWGGLSFYQRKEVKDAIAYMRLSVNHDDEEALRRIINYPTRGIGETTIRKLSRCAIDSKHSIWHVIGHLDEYEHGIGRAAVGKLIAFRNLIVGFTGMNVDAENDAYTVARRIISDSGIMAEFLSERTPEMISRRENISELINGIREFVETRREEGDDHLSLSDFLTQASLSTDQDREESGQDSVTLMTVHAAKGLEFSNVFIVGVEDELFPSSMSTGSPEGIEEERRLLYVAMTRAKHFCMMSYASSRFRNGQVVLTKPSPFLANIDSKYLSVSDSSDIFTGERMRDPMNRYRTSSYQSKPSFGTKRTAADSSRTMVKAPIASEKSESAGSQIDFDKHTHNQLYVGQSILHERFGRGVIQEIDTSQPDSRIIVKFDNDEATKKLLLKFAKFKILD